MTLNAAKMRLTKISGQKHRLHLKFRLTYLKIGLIYSKVQINPIDKSFKIDSYEQRFMCKKIK